ncbi:glycosyltransferase [Halalkalibacter wakoensis JCM 9140]|uniref:Glycosyltransferase n=1 Tax=Halalkalibacter wakoensis JCM 9140 TaxID=1236970 RepID=W4Q3Y5_9BACI|nr:glycosyltransferase family 4 protein [Halalkalibacter wakoensis]GAE26074.1 glycosyltransferase [Halalkalibacter wakoensis JCM 9140]
MHQHPRVAIVTPGTHPIPDPKSTSVETVVDEITTRLQNDVDCFIFGRKSRKHPTFEEIGQLSYFRFPYKGADSYLEAVIDKLHEVNPDIIQIENRPKYISKVRKAFPNKQIWLFVHSTVFMKRNRISRKNLIESIEAANKVIVNSHFIKEYVITQTNCDQEKVIVNHLGIDVNQFESKWSSSLQKNILSFKQTLGVENKKIILYIGRLKESKGVHHLVNVFPNIIKKEQEAVLFVVGSAFFGINQETKYVKELHKSAEPLGESVRFIPYVPHDEIQKWFQIADIIVVPSKAEPFGLVNIEAMATGATVIATNSGGIPEIIADGKNGLLLNPSTLEEDLTNTLLDLLSKPTRIKKLGKRAIQHVHAHFTWEHSAKRMLKLYETYRS